MQNLALVNGISEGRKMRLKQRYLDKKDEYLELCLQYGLPPRDMSLLLMGRRNIEPEDRIRLIRLRRW